MKKEEKKRVLHLITGVEHGGGAEAMLLKTLPFLEKTENAVCAMTGRGEIGKRLEDAGIRVFYLDMASKWDIRSVWRYFRVLHIYRPDTQVNYLIHADIFGRVFGKLFRVPKIVSYIRNKHADGMFSVLDQATLSLVDFVLTNSEANLKYYREKYSAPPEKFGCIPNGVGISNVQKTNEDIERGVKAVRHELLISSSLSLVICVARLHQQKGHNTLFDAIRRLKDDGREIHALLLGDGEERDRLEARATTLDIQKLVHFLGRRSDVGRFLEASDIFVFPSLYEGMPNALLEAMAYSKACIVSEIPANCELIQNGYNGLTFPSRDSELLAKKIWELARNPERRKKLGTAARKTVEEKYNIVKIRERLDRFLHEQSVDIFSTV